MRMYYSVKKKWMADPAQDEKVMQQLFDTANSMTNRIDEMRRETEDLDSRQSFRRRTRKRRNWRAREDLHEHPL